MALMIEAAAVLAAALQEWAEFGCIAALLAINACIGFFEEWTAIKKVAAIRSKLAPSCNVKENVRRRSSRRSSVDVEAPSGAAAAGVV